mmetsp:Transcript_3856/g.7384  ORF Transcript_3856/g.7384 Transcript_3856/m.7384 type:complete len:221 (-) Transcript_3856:1325-1987(-)
MGEVGSDGGSSTFCNWGGGKSSLSTFCEEFVVSDGGGGGLIVGMEGTSTCLSFLLGLRGLREGGDVVISEDGMSSGVAGRQRSEATEATEAAQGCGGSETALFRWFGSTSVHSGGSDLNNFSRAKPLILALRRAVSLPREALGSNSAATSEDSSQLYWNLMSMWPAGTPFLTSTNVHLNSSGSSEWRVVGSLSLMPANSLTLPYATYLLLFVFVKVTILA